MHQFITNGFQCIMLFFKSDFRGTLLYILSSLSYAFVWVLQTISLQKFFDAITRYGNQTGEFINVIYTFIFMGLVYFLYHVLDGVNNCLPEVFDIKLKKYLNHRFFEKVGNLNVLDFEDTKRLDQIEKATQGTSKLVWVGFAFLDILFYYLAYFIFISWYLFTLKPSLVLCVILIFIPSLISRFVNIKFYRELEDDLSPLRRELDYYEESILDKKFFKETRLLGITQQQFNKYMNKLNQINHLSYQTEKRKTILDISMKFINIIGYGLILIMLFTFVMNKTISIGAFAAVLTSLANIHRFMNKLIFERLGWALENFGAVENTLEVLMKEEEADYVMKDSFESLTLKNASFRYPQSNHEVLKNINLTINKGDSIAIVGVNGSGKSTLSKVLLGLYPVSKGEFLIDGIDYSTVTFDKKSAIFQKFSKYQMSLKDNIIISQLKTRMTSDKALLSLQQAGLNDLVGNLPEGMETMLGREFDGVDLSGGQWQKIAISRGLFKDHEFIVLDEPTSAIDPIEERNLYEKFQEICRDKTSVLITHRIGSAKMADRILVIKEGEIIEEGTHNELVNANSEYQKLYEEQSKWY